MVPVFSKKNGRLIRNIEIINDVPQAQGGGRPLVCAQGVLQQGEKRHKKRRTKKIKRSDA